MPQRLQNPPTASQVRAAISVVAAMKNLPATAHPRLLRILEDATTVIEDAMSRTGWTGATEEDAPFGMLAEQNVGEISRLTAMLEQSGLVVDHLQSYVMKLAQGSDPGTAAMAKTVLDQAVRVANGLPAVEPEQERRVGAEPVDHSKAQEP